jgi:hypothetical protein
VIAINRSFWLCMVLLALVAAHGGPSFAQIKERDGQTPPRDSTGDRTIDQQLLEGLNVPRKPAAPPPSESPSTPAELLRQVMQNMRSAEQRLADRDTSAATQATQRQIVEGLERLLDQSGESTGGAPSAKSNSDERNAPAQPGEGDPEQGTASAGPPSARRGASDSALQQQAIHQWIDQMWGHLPERVRNQMRAPRSEQFLPKYERTIEEYYLRLAEEQESAP